MKLVTEHGFLRRSAYGLGVLVLLGCIYLVRCEEVLDEVPEAVVRVNRLSDQVRAILEHYKSPDPVGLPGFPIPDPLPLPEIKKNMGWGTSLKLTDQYVYGLSKFKIESVYSNLADMEMFMALRVNSLQVLGNYTLTTFLSKSQGASNTTFTNLYAECSAKLKVAKEGFLEATNIDLDMSVTGVDVFFENPGLIGSVLQGAMNSAGTLIIEAIKPYILREVNSKVLIDVNKNLRGFTLTFSNSLSPLDMCIAEARKLVRQRGFDPLKLDDFTHVTGVLGLQVTHIWVYGLTSFYRVGNITVAMENNTVYIGVSAGTKMLTGHCNWEISMAGLVSTTGKIMFSVEYLEGEIKVNQSLDTRKRPNLENLQINLGNFELQFDGAGVLDYVIEALINILPNLLRNQIMLAIEEPLKIKIQEVFNEIDVEQKINEQVRDFESATNSNPTNNVSGNPPHEEGLTVDDSQLDESIL